MSDLWGGRFVEPLDTTMRRFSSSLPVDRRLARHDLVGSRAHAHALHLAGILSDDDAAELLNGLDRIEAEVDAGEFPQTEGDEVPEDIHSAVEGRLVELVGDVGRRLHAGRSRNDQVVTDMLLWLKDASFEVEDGVRQVEAALVERAEAHPGLIIPAYTHLQQAQPILLAHHLLAHFEALQRDIGRLRDARQRADRSPLGAGACAGSSLPLDRLVTAARLGFAGVAGNSIDAVADRDWAIEFASACALVMTHLSRLAEELIVWSTQEFGMARIGDAWCTGSSMMPQKRNPDAAELVRGKAPRVHGALLALHGMLKGLPLTYNRDLQEDKHHLFDVADTTRDAARIMAAALASTDFRAPRGTGPDYSVATDLAEELVRRGVPFRTAHERVGRLVRSCEAEGRSLADATAVELAEAGLADLDRTLLTVQGSIESKRTLGSTAPGEVVRALGLAKRILQESGASAT